MISYQCNRQRKRAPAQKNVKLPPITENHSKARFYAYRFEILNFVLGGFATTLGWLLATLSVLC